MDTRERATLIAASALMRREELVGINTALREAVNRWIEGGSVPNDVMRTWDALASTWFGSEVRACDIALYSVACVLAQGGNVRLLDDAEAVLREERIDPHGAALRTPAPAGGVLRAA